LISLRAIAATMTAEGFRPHFGVDEIITPRRPSRCEPPSQGRREQCSRSTRSRHLWELHPPSVPGRPSRCLDGWGVKSIKRPIKSSRLTRINREQNGVLPLLEPVADGVSASHPAPAAGRAGERAHPGYFVPPNWSLAELHVRM